MKIKDHYAFDKKISMDDFVKGFDLTKIEDYLEERRKKKEYNDKMMDIEDSLDSSSVHTSRSTITSDKWDIDKDRIERKEKRRINMENPIVKFEMEDGQEFLAELYPEIAENTVNNFISLVKDNFYDGLTFHRVIKDFMIQGGDPKGDGTGGPGYQIKGEFRANGFENNREHDKGVLSMARSFMPDSAGSQFFIMHKKSPHLDGEYAGFGRVIQGFEVIDEIANVKTDVNDKPVDDVVIKKVSVDTKDYDYKSPDKM